jgi:hypothetical protein
MITHRTSLIAFLLAGTLAAAAQSSPTPATTPSPAPAAPDAVQVATAPPPAPAAAAPATAAPAPQPAAPKIFIVPGGTKVLLELRSAINTKSAKPGDGVYLASTFPVVVGNRVLIPAGVYVQGMIDSVVRPGRGFGRDAQLNMHFTSMIFPNGSVVEIPGMVNSLPGSEHQSVNGDEGTIEQHGGSQQGHNAGETAKVAVPTGATIGSIGGLGAGHPLAGGLEGAGAGLAAAGIVALFTHKADINIPSGTQVEMVIQRPLNLEENNINGPSTLVPASAQQQPMAKPLLRDRPTMVCPTGSLGCN